MTDYERIAQIIHYLDEQDEQPSLATIAKQASLSPAHFHRLFARWAAVTPKRFLQCLTLQRAKQHLRAGDSVLDAALASGLTGPGRLHDLTVTLEGASPGELKAGGDGWTIDAGWTDTPFGTALIGTGPRGICHLSFHDGAAGAGDPEADAGARALATAWPAAQIRWNDAAAQQVAECIFATPHPSMPQPLRAIVRGSEFQLRVWRALLNVPAGKVLHYGQLAEAASAPGAARAVGTAVGQNPLGFLIPCHRVIRKTGAIGDYRWGSQRKRVMLMREAVCADDSPHPTDN